VQRKHLSKDAEAQLAVPEKQGRAVLVVDMRIVDGEGIELP
jgi:hypothetical protein